MATAPIWQLRKNSNGPVLAVALHTGHAIRPDLKKCIKVSDSARLREEDPYTGAWVDIADLGIVATRSRFEVDLNRPREKAVYRTADDAWGLDIWKRPLSGLELNTSLGFYDNFYKSLHVKLKEIEKEYGAFFIYDLHSYNHRRNGAGQPPEAAEDNPEINIGTGTMNRERWAPLINTLIGDLSNHRFMGRTLDVRENIKFKGGGFPAFIHEHFPETGCAVAIEVKKFWMDEWTGCCNREAHQAIHKALASTVKSVRQYLQVQ